MKNKLVILLISFCSFAMNAQNIPATISKSAIFKDDFTNSKIILAENDGKDGIIIVRSYKANMHEGCYLEHYDSNLKLIKDYKFEIHNSLSEKSNMQLGIIRDNNNVHIVNIYYDLKEKAYLCQANTIDFVNLSTQKKELFRFTKNEIKELGNFSLTQDFSFTDFGAVSDYELFPEKHPKVSMILNEAKNSFVINLNFSSEKTVFQKLFLFDNALNQKYSYDFKREINKSDFNYGDINLSDDGSTIYVLAKEQNGKKKEGGKYQFELTKIANKTEVSKNFDTEDHFSGSLKIINFNKKLVCLGFYSDKNDNRFKGICYYELNPETLELNKTKYNPFSEQFIIDKYGKEKDKELNNLVVKNIFKTKDGGIVLNAQEEFLSGGGNRQTYYMFNDIVSTKLNSNGDLIWARNINKNQGVTSFEDIPFISYTSIFKEKDVYFFINSDKKVNKISNNRIEFDQTRKNKSNINMIKINENGDFDYREVLNNEENEVPFMISKGMILDNSVFFLGKKKDNKQLLKIVL